MSDIALELLSLPPKGPPKGPPILLVHGAYSGAWCWEPRVMPHLAAHGHEAHALSLRGHGGSGGHDRLNRSSIADYCDDVAAAIARIGRPPLLVGHSMGGFVAQKYLERVGALGPKRVAGVLLMCSVPPEGLAASSLQLAFRDPLLWQQLSLLQHFGSLMSEPGVLRRGLFSPDVSDEEVEPFMGRFQDESQRAIVDMTWLDLPNPSRIASLPMKVVGAERDMFFTPLTIQGTAARYGVVADILPDTAHLAMLEPTWEGAAEAIRSFAETLGG